MDEQKRLDLIVEAVRYCQRVKSMGMPPACYTKSLREPIYFLWTSRVGRNKASRAQFRSKSAIGLRYGKRELVFDHALPFRYLQAKLLALTEVTPNSVRLLLEKFEVAVLITKEEDLRLTHAGLQSKMPDSWDQIDPLARYHSIGIEVVENN